MIEVWRKRIRVLLMMRKVNFEKMARDFVRRVTLVRVDVIIIPSHNNTISTLFTSDPATISIMYKNQ